MGRGVLFFPQFILGVNFRIPWLCSSLGMLVDLDMF
jgi:hypothetical protein